MVKLLRFFNLLIVGLLLTGVLFAVPQRAAAQEGDNPNPPEKTVKLVFVHHSTGENWLRDDWGGLGMALDANDYFVSDTNYGWGPNSIGDRTDIVNWLEWFGPNRSEDVLKALFNESSQNSSYTRTQTDPGGENEIIMFKSCFPNSALGGSPDDQPADGGDELTVGNAKYIYNVLLEYFLTRPDKMFVLITAPPLIDASQAGNARAFNNWLMTEWLKNYQGKNVFVFDFYNILTHPDNHHRFINGAVEYVNTFGKNTEYYPSSGGDDHPNQKGSKKATDEYVPLLNVFYHRWKAGAGSAPTPVSPTQAVTVPQPTEVETAEVEATEIGQKPSGNLIEDFENGVDNWAVNAADDKSILTYESDSEVFYKGTNSLRLDFEIASGGWASASFGYDVVMDWSMYSGLSFWMRSDGADNPIILRLWSGDPDQSTPFEIAFTTSAETKGKWKLLTFPWSNFKRADWAEESGLKDLDVAHITVYEFDFVADEVASKGAVWVDEVSLLSGEAEQPAAQADKLTDTPGSAKPTEVAEQTTLEPVQGEPTATATPKQPASPKICGSALLPVGAVLVVGVRSFLRLRRPQLKRKNPIS
jgi:hypothetical protein